MCLMCVEGVPTTCHLMIIPSLSGRGKGFQLIIATGRGNTWSWLLGFQEEERWIFMVLGLSSEHLYVVVAKPE